MNILVATIVLLLAFAAGVIAYAMIPLYSVEAEDDDEKEAVNKERQSIEWTKVLATFFEKNNWKQLVSVGATALMCAVAAFRLQGQNISVTLMCRYLLLLVILVTVMIVDLHTHRIPNVMVFVTLGMGLVLLVIECIMQKGDILGLLLMYGVGLIACLAFFYVMSRLTKDGIGMGDVKLIAAMGWMLGLSTTLIAVLCALLICTVAAVFLLFGKKKKKTDSLPFGPFVFFGYIVMLLLFSI